MSDKLREARAVAKRYLDCITDDMPPEVKLPTVNELGDALLSVVAALAQPQNDLFQDDLRDMLRALGMFDGAQPKSPHQVFQEAIVEMKRQLSAQPQNDAEAVAFASFDDAGQMRHLTEKGRINGLDYTPLYTAPLSAELKRMRKALEAAHDAFESIRSTLIKELDEPARTAFWQAVGGRNHVHEALRAGDNHASDGKYDLAFVASIKAADAAEPEAKCSDVDSLLEHLDPTPAQERREEIATSRTCAKCQGNGEIVTDWDTYLHPKDSSAEEGSVTECPDCDGEGTILLAEPSIFGRAAEFISEHDLYDESGLSEDELELLRQTPVALPPAPKGESSQEWCQPMDCGKHTPRKFIVYFDDADRGIATFDDESEARAFFERVNPAWNCYLFGALPLRREPEGER